MRSSRPAQKGRSTDHVLHSHDSSRTTCPSDFSCQSGGLFALILTTNAVCTSNQQTPASAATSKTQWAQLQNDDERAAAQTAALAATGNRYPTPAIFVKRWNLLAEALPAAQMTTFTAQGHEKDRRPIAQLDDTDFSRMDSISFQLDAPSRFIEYTTRVDEPTRSEATERSGAYILTVGDHQTKVFGQYCLWAIRSTRTAFSIHSAIQLFANAVGNGRKHTSEGATAEAEGITLILRKDERNEICEVRDAKND